MINMNLTRLRRAKHRYIFYYESPTTQSLAESPTTQSLAESPTTQIRGFFITDSAREGIAYCVNQCWNYFHKRIF